MANEALLEQVKKIRVNALYGKKKHFNAADRKEKYQLRFEVSALIINVVVTSALFKIASEDMSPSLFKYGAAVVALLAAILGALQKYFQFSYQVCGHRAIANRYLALHKKCSVMKCAILDGVISGESILEKVNTLLDDLNQTNVDAQTFITNKQDYTLSRQGVKDGEEEYTAEELND